MTLGCQMAPLSFHGGRLGAMVDSFWRGPQKLPAVLFSICSIFETLGSTLGTSGTSLGDFGVPSGTLEFPWGPGGFFLAWATKMTGGHAFN